MINACIVTGQWFSSLAVTAVTGTNSVANLLSVFTSSRTYHSVTVETLPRYYLRFAAAAVVAVVVSRAVSHSCCAGRLDRA